MVDETPLATAGPRTAQRGLPGAPQSVTAPGAVGLRRRRILFMAEAVTLAHVARPVALILGLDRQRFEAFLAVDPRYDALLPPLAAERIPIRSIPTRQFLEALANGRPVYDAATLTDYVREDLEVLQQVKPDAVVGDFRLSLAISARLSGVPYLTITNAHWSAYASPRPRYTIPEHPMVSRVGLGIAQTLFRVARPVVFAAHTLPMNRVRRRFGLPRIGWDLRRVYTEADHTLYADIAELVPTANLPPNHHYLGPILWSPHVAQPPWWNQLPTDRPIIYVTVGSSGRPDLLRTVLGALADEPATVIAATAGAPMPANSPANARVAPYLPGSDAAARAALVICNGGSAPVYQALAAGRPVLGLAGNLDQHLSMGCVCRAGAGVLLRAGAATAESIRRSANVMLRDPAYTGASTDIARAIGGYNAVNKLHAVLATAAGAETGNGGAACEKASAPYPCRA